MKVSDFFRLNRDQSTLDFFYIDVEKDVPVFIDPAALRGLNSEWGHHCVSLLQNYFSCVLAAIHGGHHDRAQHLLACLNERNEFHLGFSEGRSRGHGFGVGAAAKIWQSLMKSQAAKSGLLHDLEDTVLFIEGIGPDMLSDAVCNIIRGPLITYTRQQCAYYGIPMKNGVPSGPVWNPQQEEWEQDFISLPVASSGPLIFVPKVIVRVKQSYDADQYYRHYLMPVLQKEHLDKNSSLVHVLKGKKNKGQRKVYKSELYDLYGVSKLAAAELTAQRPAALENYKDAMRSSPSRALDHVALAKLENVPVPDFRKLQSEVAELPVGATYAPAYENAIEKLLTATFYPALSSPVKQDQIHEGRKRIDITYVNSATDGFFRWLATHHPSSHIFVECKNYGKEVGNPELDQLAGRFSPSRGKVGILVVRSLENRAHFLRRCKDTAADGRGFILVLEDSDLEELVKERSAILYGAGESPLYRQFKTLVS